MEVKKFNERKVGVKLQKRYAVFKNKTRSVWYVLTSDNHMLITRNVFVGNFTNADLPILISKLVTVMDSLPDDPMVEMSRELMQEKKSPVKSVEKGIGTPVDGFDAAFDRIRSME